MHTTGSLVWIQPLRSLRASRIVDSSKDGESFEMNVKVVQVTLESGLGHRTVPLLLAESSFTGTSSELVVVAQCLCRYDTGGELLQ